VNWADINTGHKHSLLNTARPTTFALTGHTVCTLHGIHKVPGSIPWAGLWLFTDVSWVYSLSTRTCWDTIQNWTRLFTNILQIYHLQYSWFHIITYALEKRRWISDEKHSTSQCATIRRRMGNGGILPSFFTSAPDWDEWSALPPTALPKESSRYLSDNKNTRMH
jgi:hypothetical protein